ncbi:MAG: DUF192 domain-containing protein [Gammaproteobacteria bacterium]|nr:DUF192 domain-containing protein [Gammaproteobacteria bacterium]
MIYISSKGQVNIGQNSGKQRFCGLWLALLAAALSLLASPSRAQVLDLASYPQGALEIVGKGTRHKFEIWIADTPDRQRQGLMYVRDLPANQGMLFVNESSRISSFWMKNTYIPLDMLFIDAGGKIVAVFANTTPLSLELVGPPTPVLAVLELRGGESARRGIRKGDRVSHPVFGPR